MSKQGVVARDSLENLKQALASGTLSEAMAEKGQAILKRMETPLRLSVFGLPGTGKSTLLNLLLGENVFSLEQQLPTISLVYGDEPRATFTLPSGTTKVIETGDLAEIALRKPAYIELELPLPALRKLSMMEVVTTNDPADQQRAIRWAAKRTDIALWCTQEGGPDEEQLWNLLPEHLQDHSFLVVSAVDKLGAQGRLTDVMKDALAGGRDYFRDVLPLPTKIALTARRDDGTVDKALMRSSGGIALISAILKEVEGGQRAAVDAADIFLSQIDFQPVAAEAEAEAEAEEAPKPTKPELVVVEPEAAPEPEDTEAVAEPVVADTPAEDTTVEETTSAEAPTEEGPPADVVPIGMTPAARALCRQVVDQLTAEGKALALNLSSGDLEPATVVEVSVDTVTWLADYLGDSDAAQTPAMARTCATANDAADLVQLIQLEKGENVALDALSLMIQLKHEIQAELAA